MSMVEQAREQFNRAVDSHRGINRGIRVSLAILGFGAISHIVDNANFFIGASSVDAQGLTPTPLADCLVRLRVSAQFQREGVIFGTAPNRSYLMEAGSDIAKVVTNQQGIGINQSNGREITEFRGVSDTRLPDGRPARRVRAQSLDSGQSESVDAACKGPNDPATEINNVVDVRQTQQTPGTGPTFPPRGTSVAETPAPETPVRTATRAATGAATNTPVGSPIPTGIVRAEGTPGQTQVATAKPTQTPTPVAVADTSSTGANPLEGLARVAGAAAGGARDNIPLAAAGVGLLAAEVVGSRRFGFRRFNRNSGQLPFRAVINGYRRVRGQALVPFWP